MTIALKLFVAGTTGAGQRAITNLNKILNNYVPNAWTFTVVDIHKEPESAYKAHILAVPALINASAPVSCKLIGDLSDTEKVFLFLGALKNDGNTNKQARTTGNIDREH